MKDKFFCKLDWAAFWTATVVTMAVYYFTLGPSVGLEDSGELATAAANLGVPHPPGYPFWTFCSWIFCKVFGWVTYMGHPTPAWCVSLCSAVFGAFAAGCTAMLICRSARDFVEGPSAQSQDSISPTICFAGGVAGALTFALSPVEWSQSTIVEIYSLNALFLMWVFLLSYRWMRKPSDKILWITAFVFGLGLTNYQVLLFAIVPLALIIALKNIGMFRDVFIYLIPAGLTWQLLKIGDLSRADGTMQSQAINKHLPVGISADQWGGLRTFSDGRAYYQRFATPDAMTTSCPSTTLIVIGLVLAVAAIVAVAVLMARQRAELAKKTAFALGGAGIAFLVLALALALFTSSPASWSSDLNSIAPLIEPTRYLLIGAAVVVSALLAAVAATLADDARSMSGAAFPFLAGSAAAAVVAVLLALVVPSADSLHYAGEVFPWFKSTLVFILLIVLLFVLTSFTKKGILFAIPVAGLHIAAFILLSRGAMNGLTHPASWWFAWPIAWNFFLLALAWVTLPNGRSVAGAALFTQLGVSFYAYMPIVSDLRNPPMNWGYPRTWEGFQHAITRGQYEAIGFQMPKWGVILNYFEDVRVQFTDILIPFAIVPFAVGHWIVKKENRKAFWSWMIPAVVCFLLMSVLLIGLANVKGDLQDGFIQKVKFISSHAMLALWIGYGLVFAVVFALSSLAKAVVPVKLRRIVFTVAAVMILVAFAAPLVDNYCGKYMLGVNEVAFKLGGSEQNGHTFGWQFGAYQLEGANAIREQLVADEEPLPDPTYPPPMDKFAIFFGGTDPGRFVPTYMIYSAAFRPDIYLITQNALADDTYMSVERDLYGDEIWIPAKEDSADAFDKYVKDAQSDPVRYQELLANGTLRIENGRVQVTGALAVMDINAILTKMMHDHDRQRHSFYVEESYQIQWMYPYLSPHGLIMKLNADKTPYDAARAVQDRDFWDWYMRRLLDDPMYGRDFAGQKSFSKLRAAIAGLYNQQSRYREAAQAFREAVLLYPASPEAAFRYAQECLVPYRRYDVTLELMDYTNHIDPNNTRTAKLRENITRVREYTVIMDALEKKRRDKKTPLSPSEMLSLANCYRLFGRIGDAGQLARTAIRGLTDATAILRAAVIMDEAHMDADAESAFGRYLKISPKDAQVWIDLAKVQRRIGKRSSAIGSFGQAVSLDAAAVQNRLKVDNALMDIYYEWIQTRQPRQQKAPSIW